ncbi:MAG: CapA family protein [Proteobacteria bacterium]|nr:CapA family protein [Pseudomonadota bacterium]
MLVALLWLGTAAASPVPADRLPAADPEPTAGARLDPHRPLERDLALNVGPGFVLAIGGDLLIDRPLRGLLGHDAGFQAVAARLRAADLAIANLETSLVDTRHYRGEPLLDPGEATLYAAPPELAADLASLGLRLLGRANNHALDWGSAGLRETSAALESAGVAYAGVGESLGLARRAGYAETRAARVGLVSIASTFGARADAQDGANGAPVRAGVSPLHVTATTVLPRSAFDTLRALRHELYPAAAETLPLGLFGARFAPGDALRLDYELDAADVASFLRAVRGGKQSADLLVAAIHSHEPDNSAEPVATTERNDRPAAFLRELAHAAIDAGADAWLTTGIHHVGGIEVYRGRPIFYGLGDLFWTMGEPPPQPTDTTRAYAATLAETFRHPERATDRDLVEATDQGYFAHPLAYESFIAELRWPGEGRFEARLYPVELGYGRRASETGVPRPAPVVAARAILERVIDQSRAYGTEITLEPDRVFGVVGVVRGRDPAAH